MSHTGGFLDAACLIKVPKASVGIRLKYSAEMLQVLAWMFAFTIWRIREPHCRRHIRACGTIITHICPQPCSFRLAHPWCKHWNRCVVGMQLGPRHHMLTNLIDQWGQ